MNHLAYNVAGKLKITVKYGGEAKRLANSTKTKAIRRDEDYGLLPAIGFIYGVWDVKGFIRTYLQSSVDITTLP